MKAFYTVIFALVLVTMTVSASTITFVGYEDTAGAVSDKDFNDSIATSSGIQLFDLFGVWKTLTPAVSLSNSGTPFWDSTSYDGTHDNFGDCLQGLGTGPCSNSVAATGLQYLALPNGGKVENVWFVGEGTINLFGGITADSDKIGICGVGLLGCNTPIEWITGSTFNVDILGPWEFVAFNGSQISYSDPNIFLGQTSNFAFAQGTSTPEPGDLFLVALGLLWLGSFKFKKETYGKNQG